MVKRHYFKAYSRLVEGVFACVTVYTMAGGKPLNSSSSIMFIKYTFELLIYSVTMCTHV